MYIRDIRIAKVRQIAEAVIGPLAAPPDHSDVIVMAGPNGGGKSTVLELISTAVSSSLGFGYQTRRQFPNASFEVSFGLTATDLARVATFTAENPAQLEVDERLRANPVIWRGFNFPDGEYSRDAAFYDRAVNVVNAALSGRFGALFLRSDRYYDQKGYSRNKLFDAHTRRGQQYMRGLAFNFTEQQYSDLMDFFIEEAYNYPRSIGLHTLSGGVGDSPADPLAPYNDLFRNLFPGYTLAKSGEQIADQLSITLPNGEDVPFSQLSSGEQEAFFLLSFFLRNDVSDSIVLIDEPELHLHSELVRRMIQIMRSLRSRNQLWLATHNADLIEEAGRDKTYLVVRADHGTPSRITPGTDTEGFLTSLRSMFGYSGFIGVAKRVVFLEGTSSSIDRRVFASLFPKQAEQFRFIPVSSGDNVHRVNRAILALLGEAFGYTEFYLIRDRDYLSDEAVARHRQESDRLFILDRHEIENYLLDAAAISAVTRSLLSKAVEAQAVEDMMLDECRSMAGAVLRDMVTARLNSLFQLEDCSIGKFGDGQQWLSTAFIWDGALVEGALRRFIEASQRIRTDIAARSSDAAIEAIVDEIRNDIVTALRGGNWRSVFPGKELMRRLSTRLGFKNETVFINATIRELGEHPERVDAELIGIVNRIVGPQ